MSIDDATGDDLDVYGRALGVVRGSTEPDSWYRDRIKETVLRRRAQRRCSYCGLDCAAHCSVCGRSLAAPVGTCGRVECSRISPAAVSRAYAPVEVP